MTCTLKTMLRLRRQPPLPRLLPWKRSVMQFSPDLMLCALPFVSVSLSHATVGCRRGFLLLTGAHVAAGHKPEACDLSVSLLQALSALSTLYVLWCRRRPQRRRG